MGRTTGSIHVHRVAAALETSTTDTPPDYQVTFEVPTDKADTRTPEQWARALFEHAPLPVRWFLLLGWRWVLGLRLGPRSSSDHVLGWRIAETSPDAIRLELRSSFMTAQLILRVTSSMAVLTTHVYYTRPLARPLWAVVSLIHQQMVPYLLGRAATSSRID